MSVENMKAFFEKVEGDEALQAKVKALIDKHEPKSDAAAAELVKIASEAGYDFSTDHVAQAQKAAKGELSEGDLEKVAGGYSCTG
ncbi:MAG: Nif11-like leader peptide family natural product precursor, partial [Planctomycetes bacterium]|nr:Nif11-like leader peptide family natural product precursor [Planctomycetota bacterium]